MLTVNGTKNPIIKTLKENDIVFMEVPSASGSSVKQIIRIFNLNYQPVDEKYDFDWLDFESEVLYLNLRMHQSVLGAIGNCMAITEVLPPELIETYVRNHGLWQADKYQLTDVEFEAEKMRVDNRINSL